MLLYIMLISSPLSHAPLYPLLGMIEHHSPTCILSHLSFFHLSQLSPRMPELSMEEDWPVLCHSSEAPEDDMVGFERSGSMSRSSSLTPCLTKASNSLLA